MKRIEKYLLFIICCFIISLIFNKEKSLNSVYVQNRIALGVVTIEIPCYDAPSECGFILVNANNNYTPAVLNSALEMH